MIPTDRKAIQDRLVRLLSSVAAIVLIGLVFFLGVRSERTGFISEVVDPGFRKLSDPVLNAFRKRPPPVAQITIQLDSTAWDSLSSLTRSALYRGRVIKDGNAVFAGKLFYSNGEVPIVVGLREGLEPEGMDRTWPLQVRALPGDTVLGMQTFDIVPVIDATPIWSFLLKAVMEDLGHPTLGLALAEVRVNDRNIGLCVVQGKPDASMLAGWSRGSGPVLRFDDALVQASKAAMDRRTFPSIPPAQGDWASAPLLVHSAEGPILSKRAQRATDRLDLFRSARNNASRVFDVKQVAQTLALCELLGTTSAMDWWNLRFLVDSISEEMIVVPTHLSEHGPIASIQAALLPGNDLRSIPGREMVAQLLSDTLIRGSYLAYLDTFSHAGWWEAAMERTGPDWKAAKETILAEFPRLDLDLNIVEHDRTVIRQALIPEDLLLAYMQGTERNRSGLALANLHDLPVEVMGVIGTDGDTTRFPQPVHLAARMKDRPLYYIVVPLPETRNSSPPAMILSRIAGPLKWRTAKIRTWTTFGAN